MREIGTYESFLQAAGLRPPYLLPPAHTPQGAAFQKACLDKARTIVRGIERAGGLEAPLKGEVITGPCRFPAITGTETVQPGWTPSPLERQLPPKLRGGYEQIWLPWTPGVTLDQSEL